MCIRDRMNKGETNDEHIIENSTDEVLECDNAMFMCINELERKWKNNIVIEWGQRANFQMCIRDRN